MIYRYAEKFNYYYYYFFPADTVQIVFLLYGKKGKGYFWSARWTAICSVETTGRQLIALSHLYLTCKTTTEYGERYLTRFLMLVACFILCPQMSNDFHVTPTMPTHFHRFVIAHQRKFSPL
ncbi:hypothetical protein CEXT_613011 [Caerostris extrusa]|uniref:Uncharacterized protein n=1 Tax=Caerostris extrusa TaxID=172846 RepID=A0AAV4V2H9_CAEEX|nr:hypothetical protein CEXT_613011 [Caerostris extrusa]